MAAKWALLIGLILCLTSSASAQKAPELGYVFPPALPIGQTSQVQLGGYDFTTDLQFFVYSENVKLEVTGRLGEFLVPKPPYWFGPKGRSTALRIPREFSAAIDVLAGAKPGLVHWQVANANGSSNTAVFYLSDGNEMIEQRYRDEPQGLATLPVAVSGRIERISEVDRYELDCDFDGPVTVELFARRLGSNFNGVLKVREAGGAKIVDRADTQGRDITTTFFAQTGKSYTISLHDTDFRGNRSYVYRLAFTRGPRVVTTIPARGRHGETSEVEFIGYGVATGADKLESVTRPVTFPADTRVKSKRYALKTAFGVAPAIEIPLGSLTASRSEPSDQPFRIDGPRSVTSRLGPDPARFEWTAQKGETWLVAARSIGIGTSLDLHLRILDSSGKQVAENDDASGSTDSFVTLKIPADGDYLAVVSNVANVDVGQVGVFELVVERPTPGFTLSVPQRINVVSGGKVDLEVKSAKRGGFDGDVSIEILGLPTGLTVPDKLLIPKGKNSLKVPIQCDKSAPVVAASLRVIGRCDGVSCYASAAAAGSLCPTSPSENAISDLLLAVTLKPPFSLELVDKNRQRAVHRGTTYPAEFVIKRAEGYHGPVSLQMAAGQGRHRQGITAPVLTVPPDVDRVQYPCFMPEWLETDRTTRMVVLGVAAVKDPTGRVREVTAPANARITMILEGALLKLSHQANELSATAGDRFTIPIEVFRSAKFRNPIRVELVVPEELTGLLHAQSIELASDRTRAEVLVETVGHPRLTGLWELQLKATGMQQAKWPVVSQTTVPVSFQ